MLVDIFTQANILVKSEELKSVDDSMFVFKEEVKELLAMIFSLCEYNLKLIFQNKTQT